MTRWWRKGTAGLRDVLGATVWMRPAPVGFFFYFFFSLPQTSVALQCFGFLCLTPPPLRPRSLASVHPSGNADSEGHFLSSFNDPCDFSARKCFLRGSSTCLPRPSSPGGGRGGGGPPLPPLCRTPPPVCGVSPLPPRGADEGVE